MNLLSILKSVFSFTKASDTAVDIVRKFTGVDGFTDQQKAQFILDYMKTTEGQSMSRRVIALSLTFIYVLLILVWLVATCFGASSISIPIEEFLDRVVLTPFNLVLSFYFVINIAKAVK